MAAFKRLRRRQLAGRPRTRQRARNLLETRGNASCGCADTTLPGASCWSAQKQKKEKKHKKEKRGRSSSPSSGSEREAPPPAGKRQR